ncbi:phage tail repeat-like family [Trichomonas vaginalis G3]|uniref:phage tail repeat-like family n=1 Tax=Trichomonas vaginalis (strain ATCC PRA-98 / G3) TaxID=412133 RepID=UPI0021E606D4|nr:phage tail repeat-like family [Trichomonas vaginalis G3]KAI5514970.1 phage tail repeat-like family [Trichomonas vaginalis G3]
MSNETASMREIQHNRQLIVQALNKNTTNFSNYSKISESLKEGNLKLTLNPLTDEFLFQDNKNHTVCINPTKGTLNEKPINELLLKADVDNKADKEYVDDAIAKEEERANNAYATKEHTHPELADKTYVDNKMSSEVTRAENEYSKKTHTHSISEITDLNVSLEKKADEEYVASKLEKKADKEYVDEKDNEIIERAEWYHEWTSKILKTKADTGWVSGCLDLKADKTYVNDELEKKANKTHTHTSFTTFTADDIILNFDLGSSAPLENPSTSVKDTLNSLDNSCRNIESHARNFEAHELPAMLDKKADKTELQTLKTEILQTLYPIGSIYTSMNSTNPETVLGFGTWTQIVDRFLYCANSSKETGGSKTISGANLPAHSHYIDLSTSQAGWHSHRYIGWSGMTKGKGYDVKDDVKFAINGYWSDTQGDGNHTHFVSGYTQTTGQSKDYMPPYMTVYAWYRNA